MPQVVELAAFRPSPRHDGVAWSQIRVDQASDPGGDWTEVETLEIESVDADPERPQLRSVTTEGVTEEWVRLVFLGESGEDRPCPYMHTGSIPFLPTLADISSILRARTYSKGVVDPDNPMSAVAGGVLEGEFSDGTRPTAQEVEGKFIPQASRDLLTAVGTVPGLFLDRARRIAALRVAVEIERSFVPELSEGKGSIYQTLRMTYDEEVEKLQTTLQWWALSQSHHRRRPNDWCWPIATWDPWWWAGWL